MTDTNPPQSDPLLPLLEQVAAGDLSLESAAQLIRHNTAEGMGFATIDHARRERCGFPEVIYGAGKNAEQIISIAQTILKRESCVLITRVQPEHIDAVTNELQHHYPVERGELSYTVIVGEMPVHENYTAIPIVTAGTSDLPIAEEALLTCKAFGHPTLSINDVGVAGLHRLLHRVEEIRQGHLVICIAGMEAALPSVVGGLVSVPVIAVPTSVGYGVADGGKTALHAILTSCASGVLAVNIDNGFGAAYTACQINARIHQQASQES